MSHDATLPVWQQKLNQFCENWLYAFLIAMVIRHFALEAFQIPTASMEPMLYGDAAFLKRDQVVVDKLTPRFTGIHRWDVAVFQYPRPEVEEGGDGRPAVSADGQHLDSLLWRPLFCRNFVKRVLVVPGDTFYISGGNLYLKQADGTFACARKPEAVQEAVWEVIYRHGDQDGYLPWTVGPGGSGATASGADLRVTIPAEGAVTFTQPIRNLYFKPGPVRVAPLTAAPEDVGTSIESALTKPVFTYGTQRGNVWDLDQWRLRRVTTRDLDSGTYGTEMNPLMNEFVTDTRWRFRLVEATGTPVLRFDLGTRTATTLALPAGAWILTVEGKEIARGVRGAASDVAFGRIDDQIVLRLDGQEVVRHDVTPCDGTVNRPRWSWTGSGAVTLAGAILERDLHYAAKGFLANEAPEKAQYEQKLRTALAPLERDKTADALFRIGFVREQLRGGSLTGAQRTDRCGTSPETAITAPPGAYLMLGDNSPFSLDSRMWGWVPEDNFRGRALLVMFPPWRWHLIR